ncbi:hypothetical protein DCOP10_11514 [Armatimonadetes bacterium DC]|nr:hypothetical protein DCOP10_11514 [Armatimonadetes bacterium DC]
MLVKRWIVVATGSLLLTALLVWAHECQKPTPNCPESPRKELLLGKEAKR